MSKVCKVRVVSVGDRAAVHAMSSTEEELYVLCQRVRNNIELEIRVHSNADFTFQHCFLMPSLTFDHSTGDMIACAEHKCLYLVVYSLVDTSRVFKIMTHNKSARPDVTKWQFPESPLKLSLTRQASDVLLLVAFHTGEWVEVNEQGQRVRKCVLQTPVDVYLHYAVALNVGQYVVSYREKSCMRRKMISVVDYNGTIMQSYGNSWIPWRRLGGPGHMAVDSDGFVFVNDNTNSQVVLLNPFLQFVRSIATEKPSMNLHFDQKSRRLFVCHIREVSVFQL